MSFGPFLLNCVMKNSMISCIELWILLVESFIVIQLFYITVL